MMRMRFQIRQFLRAPMFSIIKSTLLFWILLLGSLMSVYKGYLTFGPYVNLLIGDYALEIHYYAQKGEAARDIGKWDVVVRAPNNNKRQAL